MTVFKLPEKIKTEKGELRHVGFELEYSGIDLDQSAYILQQIIGEEPIADSAFYYSITDKKMGTFSVEVDAALLRDGKYCDYLSDMGIKLENKHFKKKLDELLKEIASTVVPCEIVTPPLPVNNMDIVEHIVNQLRKGKAEGTSASIIYAFGLHMNPELVSDDAGYLLSHIRAFAVLYDWICDSSDVDVTRKLTPYIDSYPNDYLKHILVNDYQPDIKELIQDYMLLVGTRNQALDMLPAFAKLDKERVMSQTKEPDLIKPRPAFHYRLANSLIDKPDWSVSDEWLYWLKIEMLANDKSLLNKLCEAYSEQINNSMFYSKSAWVKYVDSIINN